MEENHAFVGTDDIIQDGSSNRCKTTTMNDRRLVEEDNLNIATMSDFQFSESLDALIDNSYTENAATQSPTSSDVPTCFDVDETSFAQLAQQEQQQQQPVTVHDNSYSSLPVNNSGNNIIQQQQQQQSTASNPFFPNFSTPQQMMMPLGVDPNSFLTATQNNNFVASSNSSMPPLTLQQSIEAFGQSIASHNLQQQQQQQQQQQVFTVPSFAAVMCAPPPLHTMSTSFSTLPMVGSNMSLGGVSSSTTAAVKKRGHNSTFPISEDESDFRKRKSDRNAREQQRAQQVTDQIAHLRDLIVRSGVALDKVDKFSTLIAVEQYIRSLQTKSLELKTEHDNLLATLQQTSELVNSQYVSSASPVPVSSGGEESFQAQDSSDQDTDDLSEGDTTAPLMKEVNYKWIFNCCPFATGVASIDGRFLDCNKEFEVMTGYTRAELLPLEHQNINDDEEAVGDNTSKPEAPKSTTPDDTAQPSTPKKSRNMSIFNVLHRECIERLFCAMSTVLQKCNNTEVDEDKTESDEEEKGGDSITQEVMLCKRSNQKVGLRTCSYPSSILFPMLTVSFLSFFFLHQATIRITLVRSPKGLPRFFNCVLIPLGAA